MKTAFISVVAAMLAMSGLACNREPATAGAKKSTTSQLYIQVSAIGAHDYFYDHQMGLKLAGEMPSLPSQNSSLRAALIGNKDYMDGLIEVSDRLGGWIEAAQAQGSLNPKLPAIAVLYTLYARACDPVLEFLKMSELHSDEEIISLVMSTCFDGLNSRAG